jgi:multiple sugar transport system permease protein
VSVVDEARRPPEPADTGRPARARPARGSPAARRRRARRLTYAAAVVLSAWVLIPIYLITVTAFTPRRVSYQFPKPLVPTELSGETVSFFARSAGVLPALGRSVMVAVVTLGLSTLLGAPAGYALARYRFRGKEAYRLLILSTRAFPVVILSIPLAVNFITWGIYDTVISVALMHTALALPFTVLITSSIFVSVPRDLEEAAQTLGCTPARAFVRVVLPLALPGLAAASIFTFVLSWNEVFAAVILTLRNRTLPALVLSGLSRSPLPFRFAAAFFLLAPSLIVIFVIRRYLLGLWGRVSR